MVRPAMIVDRRKYSGRSSEYHRGEFFRELQGIVNPAQIDVLLL